MEPSVRIFTSLLLMFLPMHSDGFPNGKVEAACETMEPNHNARAQTSTSPYSLSYSSVNHTGIFGFNVTLSKDPNGVDFKGFMIQAHAPGGNTPQGTFVVSGTDGLAQTLNCNGPENTVSHTSPVMKSTISVTWLPPKKASTNIQFRATVVQTKTVFWTNVLSDVIPLDGAGSQLLAPALSQLLLCSTVLIYALVTI